MNRMTSILLRKTTWYLVTPRNFSKGTACSISTQLPPEFLLREKLSTVRFLDGRQEGSLRLRTQREGLSILRWDRHDHTLRPSYLHGESPSRLSLHGTVWRGDGRPGPAGRRRSQGVSNGASLEDRQELLQPHSSARAFSGMPASGRGGAA